MPNETVEKLSVEEYCRLERSGLSQGMGYFLLMNPSIPVDFTNVMDKSEQHPLDIDLGFGAKGEVVQPFLHPEMGKDRFHDCQPP